MPIGLNSLLQNLIAPRPDGWANLPGHQNGPHRDRWVQAQFAALPAGWRLLDVGAGEMPYKKFCAHLEYVSQDFAAYEGQGDGNGLQMGKFSAQSVDMVCDILEIPAPEHSFDAVLCTEVLEHVPDPVRALEKICGLIRPSGRLLITAPFSSLAHFTPYYYCTGFSEYFWKFHLERLGFTKMDITPLRGIYDVAMERLRRSHQLASEAGLPPLTRWQMLAFSIARNVLERWSLADSSSRAVNTMGLMVSASKE